MAETQESTKKDKAEVTTVVMEDGKPVDFVGKRKMVKDTFVAPDGTIMLRIDFRNGAVRQFELNPSLLTKFAAHGAEQKYGDETAGLTDEDDMVEAVDQLHDRLSKGEWTQKRDASGLAGTSVLLRALVKVKGKTVEQIRAFLSDKTPAQKIALRNHPSIKPVVEQLEAEKATKASKVNVDELMEGLDAAA